MISVIIRNKNESEYIGFALQSICDYFPGADVIVVDNNSTDDSLSIVKMFNTRLNLRIVNIDNYTPGKALNMALQHCNNDIVLILSAHSQIVKMNFNYIKANLKKFAAVFGNQTPIYRGKKIFQ